MRCCIRFIAVAVAAFGLTLASSTSTATAATVNPSKVRVTKTIDKSYLGPAARKGDVRLYDNKPSKQVVRFRGWDRKRSPGAAIFIAHYRSGHTEVYMQYNPQVVRPFRGYATDVITCKARWVDEISLTGYVACTSRRHYLRTGKYRTLAQKRVVVFGSLNE